MHAACTGHDVPARASNGFVERTFDGFAASFESKLERLSYRAPALVAAMIEEAGVERAKRLDVLDAGCGTGLCGPLLAPYARRLVGRRSLGRHADAGEGEGDLRHARTMRADAVPRRQPRAVRSDRLGRHARLLRRPGSGRIRRGGRAAVRTGSWFSRSSMPSRPRKASTTGSNFTGDMLTRGPMSSGSLPHRGCARTSPKPTCAWSLGCPWPAWWCGRRKHERSLEEL